MFRTQWTCARCKDVTLGTRLATFTYLKALDFPMFQKSWFAAERLLRKAKRWVFIGYSLPTADYEFKYLLKRVQLSRRRKPEVILITKGSDTEKTFSTYQRFFGQIMKRRNFFDNEKPEADPITESMPQRGQIAVAPSSVQSRMSRGTNVSKQ